MRKPPGPGPWCGLATEPAPWPAAAAPLSGLDDHELVLVVVPDEEQQRHRALATYQLGVDVPLAPQLRVICRRVGRFQGDARRPPRLVPPWGGTKAIAAPPGEATSTRRSFSPNFATYLRHNCGIGGQARVIWH